MPAIHDAYEHFIKTGELLGHIPTPRGEVVLPKMTAYFTYEVGTDEPAHPDRDIAARFVEVAMSDCKYGCKIYADPYSEVRVLVHSKVYGCNMTMVKLDEQRAEGAIRPGDSVEFNDRHDPMIVHTGKVLNRIEESPGHSESFRVGCYYIVDLGDLRAVDSGETYQQAWARLFETGIMDEQQIAAYFGVTVETLRNMKLMNTKELAFEGNEFKHGDWVTFQDLLDPKITRKGQIRRYIPPSREFNLGGYEVVVPDTNGPWYALVTRKDALTRAD